MSQDILALAERDVVTWSTADRRFNGALHAEDIRYATVTAKARQNEAVAAGRPDRHGYKGDGYSVHLLGSLGELAVCRLLGVAWDASVNTFKKPDVLDIIQVRTRSRDDYDLLVRGNDANDEIFVHVTLNQAQAHLTIHGAIEGGDAKQPQWRQTYGGRPPAYFVPATVMQPLEPL